MFLLIQDILKIAFKPPKLEDLTPITNSITTGFRKKQINSRNRLFEKYIYENNNKDGKLPVDLTKIIDYMKHIFPPSSKYSVADVFKGIMEELHNEILTWNQKHLEEVKRIEQIRVLEREKEARNNLKIVSKEADG